MLDIVIELKGRTPLWCHNPQLANPDNKWAKAIRQLTGKRTKTEEDRREIARLEWWGGLYLNGEERGPIYPCWNVLRCLNEAAKRNRKGADVFRALTFSDLDVPIQYPGSRDCRKLEQNPVFRDERIVGVQRARTMRCRPQFVTWALTVQGILLEDELDLADLKTIIERAGRLGLGEGRALGMGRFTAEVTVK
jgi:hypothetical protein